MSEQNEPVLQFEDITKSYSGTQVLKGVSFDLHRGKVLGLVGENGAGKSTLMNILGGVTPHDGGQMRLNGEVYKPQSPKEAEENGIAFIHQELNLFTNLTVAENIYISKLPVRRFAGVPYLNRREMYAKTADRLRNVGLDVSPDTPVEQLPQGERQLVEIARALDADARIIIFDEPTTSLTKRETERLFDMIGQLRERDISMIYISHILEDVYRLCDEIVVLRDGEWVGSGLPDTLEESETIRLMIGRDFETLFPDRDFRVGEPIFEARSLSVSGVIKDISFSLREGEILGVFGMMGSGRTELARVLFGVDPLEQGELVYKGQRVTDASPPESIDRRMAFLTEDRHEEGLLLDKSITENVALAALPTFTKTPARFLDRGDLRAGVRNVTQRLRVASSNPTEQAVQTLSGGNQQKVVFGKWLLTEPLILIVDEPTRGIDVGAKHEVYEILGELSESGAGILFISSELEELTALCDRILVMVNGEVRTVIAQNEFDHERILQVALGGTEE
jgi:ribose transport system ATP-binding protein